MYCVYSRGVYRHWLTLSFILVKAVVIETIVHIHTMVYGNYPLDIFKSRKIVFFFVLAYLACYYATFYFINASFCKVCLLNLKYRLGVHIRLKKWKDMPLDWYPAVTPVIEQEESNKSAVWLLHLNSFLIVPTMSINGNWMKWLRINAFCTKQSAETRYLFPQIKCSYDGSVLTMINNEKLTGLILQCNIWMMCL